MTVLAVLGRADDAVLQTAVQLGETLAVVIASAAPPAERLSALARAGVSRVIQIWDTALAEPLKDTLEREPVTVTLLKPLNARRRAENLLIPPDWSMIGCAARCPRQSRGIWVGSSA